MKKISHLFLVASMLVASAVSSFAAMAPADEALVLSGITSSDTTFYKIGGGIMVVLAGIWGFRKVQGLLGSK